MVILIGLTGGIACGKSTVSECLSQEYHFTVIDADKIVHELQMPGTSCYRLITKKWPEVVDGRDDGQPGPINRAKLGGIVFANAEARAALGKIMHQAIFMAILKKMFWSWWRDVKSRTIGRLFSKGNSPTHIVILDAPTLYESKYLLPFLSNALVIACSEERQKQRLLRRPHPHHPSQFLSETEAEQRIRSQMPLKKKMALAGYVIMNDKEEGDSKTALRSAVEECVCQWMPEQPQWRLDVLFGLIPLLLLVGSVSLVTIAAMNKG